MCKGMPPLRQLRDLKLAWFKPIPTELLQGTWNAGMHPLGQAAPSEIRAGPQKWTHTAQSFQV